MFAFTPRSPGILSFEPGPADCWETGRLIETLPNGKVFEIGKVQAWAPPHRLVFGWRQASFAPDQPLAGSDGSMVTRISAILIP